MSNHFQVAVNRLRYLLPRGWAPFISLLAKKLPCLQNYQARLINGDCMYLDLREYMCLGIFFYGGQPHEFGTEKLLSKILNPDDVVIDIGANIGYYTRIASRLVGSNGAVIAFEPMPAAYRLLVMNCAELANVSHYQLAISDKDGETLFYIQKYGDRSSLEPDSLAKVVRVKTSTADNFLAGLSQVDFIKIDVEGYELEILRGAIQTILNCRPIVYFEFLEVYSERRGFSFEDFQHFFYSYNYDLKWIDHSKKNSEVLSDVQSNYVLAIPREKQEVIFELLEN